MTDRSPQPQRLEGARLVAATCRPVLPNTPMIDWLAQFVGLIMNPARSIVTLTWRRRSGMPWMIVGSGSDFDRDVRVRAVDVDRRADHHVAEVERARLAGRRDDDRQAERRVRVRTGQVHAAGQRERLRARAGERRDRADLRGRRARADTRGRIVALRDGRDAGQQARRAGPSSIFDRYGVPSARVSENVNGEHRPAAGFVVPALNDGVKFRVPQPWSIRHRRVRRDRRVRRPRRDLHVRVVGAARRRRRERRLRPATELELQSGERQLRRVVERRRDLARDGISGRPCPAA